MDASTNWLLLAFVLLVIALALLVSRSRGAARREMEKVARHEMIHLLLARLQEYSQRRNVIQVDIDEAVESLVRMIDNVYLMGQESGCDCPPRVLQWVK